MITYLRIFSFAMCALGIYAILTTLLNQRHFRKLGNVKTMLEGPLISIIIPARDEEKNISRLLDSLISQSYENIEILVINDQSSDRTGEIIREYEKKDKRICYYETDISRSLSTNGKINALLQVIEHARGEYILATDADTEHKKDSVAHAYSIMKENKLDIISGFPTEICPSFMGSVNISSILFTSILIPHFLVYYLPSSSASFAIGQFIMMRRDAYMESGGYGCIKSNICDDVGLVRLFVKNKKRYAFVSISEYVNCYMYETAKEAFSGIERSIAGVFPPKAVTFLPLFALVLILLHLSLAPLIAILLRLALGPDPHLVVLITGWLLFYLAWYKGARNINFRKTIGLSAPLTLFQIALMYLHGLYRGLSGKGFVWKGRKVINK